MRYIVAVGGLHSCPDQSIKELVMRTCITLFQQLTGLAEKSGSTKLLDYRIPVYFGYLKVTNPVNQLFLLYINFNVLNILLNMDNPFFR